MTEHELEIEEQQAILFGAVLRKGAERGPNGGLRRQEEQLRAALERTKASRVSQPRRWVLAAIVLGVAVMVLGLVRGRSAHPLSVELVGAGRVSSSYVTAPEETPATLRFSDGSTVVVERGSRLRLHEALDNGATMMLERGRVTARVVHRDENTRWSVLAGPFSIHVVGTQFSVDWNVTSEELVVDLFEGAVEIDGPTFKEPAVVRRGQRFQTSAGSRLWSVVPLSSGDSVSPLSSAAPSVSVAAVPRSPDAVPEGGSRREPAPEPALVAPRPRASGSPATSRPLDATGGGADGPSWPKIVARGDFARVVHEAESEGLVATLERASAPQLRALADAARYTGRFDVAEGALRALRSRHPAQASVATYLLGQVAEARGRNEDARKWYDDYLAESPSGGFAPEARAGRLRMVVATRGVAAARELAKEYLRTEPNGVGATAARRVLEGP
jgi:hypothetical protein